MACFGGSVAKFNGCTLNCIPLAATNEPLGGRSPDCRPELMLEQPETRPIISTDATPNNFDELKNIKKPL